MMKINFEKMFPQGSSGRSDDVQFVYEFAIDQQKKGDLSDEEILKQCVSHLADQSNFEEVTKVVKLNDAAASAINGLVSLRRHMSLRGIAEHATEERAKLCEAQLQRDTSIGMGIHLDRAAKSARLSLAVMQGGTDAYGSVFTQEFLTKHGWVENVSNLQED